GGLHDAGRGCLFPVPDPGADSADRIAVPDRSEAADLFGAFAQRRVRDVCAVPRYARQSLLLLRHLRGGLVLVPARHAVLQFAADCDVDGTADVRHRPAAAGQSRARRGLFWQRHPGEEPVRLPVGAGLRAAADQELDLLVGPCPDGWPRLRRRTELRTGSARALNLRRLRRNIMRTLKYLFAASAFALLSQAQAQTAQKVEDIPTRSGVTQRMIVLAPLEPKAAVVLLAGGHGGLQVFPNGSLKWGAGNFLVRTRQLFADQGLMVA